jgi:hypothetical protein
MEHTNQVKIVIEAKDGVAIAYCFDDAITLALKQDTMVSLTHSNNEYTVNPFLIRHFVADTGKDVRTIE